MKNDPDKKLKLNEIPEQFRKTFLPEKKKLFYKLMIGGSLLGIAITTAGRLAFQQKSLEQIEFDQMMFLWHAIVFVVICLLSAYLH